MDADKQEFLETIGIPDFAWWMYDEVCIGMGAERHFDYTLEGSTFKDRISRCYELAAKAFSGWAEYVNHLFATGHAPNLPAPVGLVHGTWHGPQAPRRIAHAWVLLEDGRVWEPITAVLCERGLFDTYTSAEHTYLYDRTQATLHMARTRHFGPWGS